jgi:ornithine decarboxylase
VRLFAVDCHEEVEKIARVLRRGARVLPHPDRRRRRRMAAVAQVRLRAADGADVLVTHTSLGLVPHGVSFHVGSQMTNIDAWDKALEHAKRSSDELRAGHHLKMVNMGGGFPTRYLKDVPTAQAYGRAIFDALRKHFGNRIPRTIIEPGRGMVGNAGVIKAEVVLISRKSDEDDVRWVYLDIGKFGGLAETMDEAIRYPIRTPRDGDAAEPCVLAGPTCDSATCSTRRRPMMPLTLTIGDEVLIEGLRRLHDDLFVDRLQRLRAAALLRDLSADDAGTGGAPPTAGS